MKNTKFTLILLAIFIFSTIFSSSVLADTDAIEINYTGSPITTYSSNDGLHCNGLIMTSSYEELDEYLNAFNVQRDLAPLITGELINRYGAFVKSYINSDLYEIKEEQADALSGAVFELNLKNSAITFQYGDNEYESLRATGTNLKAYTALYQGTISNSKCVADLYPESHLSLYVDGSPIKLYNIYAIIASDIEAAYTNSISWN